MSDIVERLQAEASHPVMAQTGSGEVELSVLQDALAEIERLRRDCFEAYQAVGTMADALGFWGDGLPEADQQQILRLLDNLSSAGDGRERPHDNLLPFVLSEEARTTMAPPRFFSGGPRGGKELDAQ